LKAHFIVTSRRKKMTEDNPSGLEEIAPLVQEHLLPLIDEAVDTCVRTYVLDEFSDTYIFGTQLWRLTWNRCLALAGEEGSPFSHSGDSKDYSIRLRGIKIEPHPVSQDTRLPNNAKAIKERLAAVQLDMFAGSGEEAVWLPESAVLAISASPEEGLLEVFLGVLQKNGFSGQYEWREVVPVYQRLEAAEDTQTAGAATSASVEQADVEPEFEPDIEIDLEKEHQQDLSQAEENE